MPNPETANPVHAERIDEVLTQAVYTQRVEFYCLNGFVRCLVEEDQPRSAGTRAHNAITDFDQLHHGAARLRHFHLLDLAASG
jgi:hypothetical protein